MFNIMVVDDHAHIRRLYEVTLEKNGYKPYTACNGREALSLMETTHIDLIVLDIMMPEMDGYAFLRTLRDSGVETPVLVITARDSAEDVRKAFTLGTDDFMVKPVDEIEMLLRIKALMRRAKISEEKKIIVGGTELIYDSLTVKSGGDSVQLPKKEFQILFKLLSFPGKTFTRANLMDEFWAMDSDSEMRTVDVHINRLRDRFRDNLDFEIVTVRGLGYKAVHKAKGND
ncbi:MAG: response regulator transcription factor [Oscillospiraceae bacterium]|nr:response regulator transcription factor [Oscillospiraceae bacterium]